MRPSAAQGVAVVSVAMVSNAVDHEGEEFNTGPSTIRIIKGCARACERTLTDRGQVSS
jgi:hypothetical protein